MSAVRDPAVAEEQRRATMELLHEQISQGMTPVADDWAAHLSFARSFHDYSFPNRVALYPQNTGANHVPRYRAWLAMGRQMRRGKRP